MQCCFIYQRLQSAHSSRNTSVTQRPSISLLHKRCWFSGTLALPHEKKRSRPGMRCATLLCSYNSCLALFGMSWHWLSKTIYTATMQELMRTNVQASKLLQRLGENYRTPKRPHLSYVKHTVEIYLPLLPWCGGFYERLIRYIEMHLSLGMHLVHYTELQQKRRLF